MEQGTHPPAAVAAAADLDRLRRPRAAPPSSPTTGVGGSEGSAVGGLGFPEDPLTEILSRLPAKPLFRFKCVSKAWFALVADCLRKLPQTLQGFFYGEHFLPEIEKISLMRSCNGLVLLRHTPFLDPNDTKALGYIVCNPATKEWVDVPNSGWTLKPLHEEYYNAEDAHTITYLFFDPAVSLQFKLFQFCQDFSMNVLQVNTYSSESGVWSGRAVECWSHEAMRSRIGSAFVNGMLHWTIFCRSAQHNALVAVDGEGEKCRIIHWPNEERGLLVFLGQSQGLLHCMSGRMDDFNKFTELSIWVLEDYDAEKWILKHSVSCLHLFGEPSCCVHNYHIAIHPDHNLVFFVQRLNKKLISYDLDSKELSVLYTLEHNCAFITPYVPYFVESSVLVKKS
ncbi:hypothetical protein SETIT_2G065900v2 [Setaria italica]|uniref:F-box domain-containing protein n=1 Tax=Setaria italica TaxID=4555 RepID=A0A368PWS1_SETIT|nr:hypothetical protein SETIT_2G065900v2 [Setaria italica]